MHSLYFGSLSFIRGVPAYSPEKGRRCEKGAMVLMSSKTLHQDLLIVTVKLSGKSPFGTPFPVFIRLQIDGGSMGGLL